MHKITTIILLCCAFLMTATDISAQNADFKLLKSINNNPSTILRGYSRFVTNTTTGFALAAPVAAGVQRARAGPLPHLAPQRAR